MPDEMATSGEPAKKGKPIIWLGIILAIIIAGLIWWQYQKGSLPTFPQISPTPTVTIGTPSPIVWQTYSNAKYGYSLNYPQGWTIDTTNAEKDFSSGTGGVLLLSNYANPMTQLQTKNPPSDITTMILTIYQISSQTTADQFIKTQKYLPPLSQAPVVFNGLPGKQLLYTSPRNNTEVLNIMTVIKQNTKMFVFSYYSFKPDKLKLPGAVTTIHDEMLKSFKIK